MRTCSCTRYGEINTYAYNGLGDRVKSTLNGVTTQYALDLNSGLTQVLDDGVNTYVYGFTRLAQVNDTATGYFLTDALGSVRQVTDTAGAITLVRDYSPYGETVQSLGSFETPYSFTGEMIDLSGLVFLRARYREFCAPERTSRVGYDPATGRFVSRDTWEVEYDQPGTENRFAYVNADPISHSDPSGHMEICEGAYKSPCSGPLLQDWKKPQTTSARGYDFLKREEGRYKRFPYNDSDNVAKSNCTIGYGYLLHFGPCVNCEGGSYMDPFTHKKLEFDPQGGISELTALQLMIDRVKLVIEPQIHIYINTELTQYQFDALADLLYNKGSNTLHNFPDFVALINNRTFEAAGNFILTFNLDAYKTEVGIINIRRQKEVNLFLHGDYDEDENEK